MLFGPQEGTMKRLDVLSEFMATLEKFIMAHECLFK